MSLGGGGGAQEASEAMACSQVERATLTTLRVAFTKALSHSQLYLTYLLYVRGKGMEQKNTSNNQQQHTDIMTQPQENGCKKTHEPLQYD